MFSSDGYCYYPIHEAANYKKHQDAYEIVKMLADGGADLEKPDCNIQRQPLEMAAAMGHLQVVKFLEERGAKVSDKKLFREVMQDKMDAEATGLLQYLVDRNPDYLARKQDQMFKCCVEGDFGKLEALIKVGANVHAKNSEGQSLLEVVGTKPSWENAHVKQWPTRLQKMKTVLEKAMKKKIKK
jgi:ankyrin repeat protein